DFCYAIIDLEDGLEMGLLDWDTVHKLLKPVLPDTQEVNDLLSSNLRVGRKAALLRGNIIERFIESGVQAFLTHHYALLKGTLRGDLISHCHPDVKQVVDNAKPFAKTKVVEHPRKVELEISALEEIR